jgi:hypothetical protein
MISSHTLTATKTDNSTPNKIFPARAAFSTVNLATVFACVAVIVVFSLVISVYFESQAPPVIPENMASLSGNAYITGENITAPPSEVDDVRDENGGVRRDLETQRDFLNANGGYAVN